MMDVYAASFIWELHVLGFQLQRLSRFVAFFIIVSTCSLNESLLSKITPLEVSVAHLSDAKYSKGLKLRVGGLNFTDLFASISVLSSMFLFQIEIMKGLI